MTPEVAGVSTVGGVRFLDEGTVSPRRASPIMDSLRDPHSIVGEELRLLRARLRDILRDRRMSCVALTSALPGEGKSTISLGLAAACAREPGRRVLLVEADLRRPSVAATLQLPPAPGLGEWLEGNLDQVPVRRVEPGGFHLIVAGQVPLRNPETMGSPLMEALLRAARSDFDVVLLDAPPVLSVSDTILLQDLVDGYLLVARSRLSPRAALVDALGRLRSEKVMGVVLNDHQEYRHSYTRYAYERYGMTYGASPRPEAGQDES